MFDAAADRYDHLPYRRCGRSGLMLPAISLGLWQNFGDDRPVSIARGILRHAFERGITHFDLANNYGSPYGAAESTAGRIFAEDFARYRDEIVISTKAGNQMWDGPYGMWGSRKHLLASLDQSLRRLHLDYVDIFYSHRFDPETPLEETMAALDTAVRSGKARYAGVSNYSAEQADRAATIFDRLGTPLTITQPSYSMIDRWIEPDLLAAAGRHGTGVIVYSPLAQGLLTDKYLTGIPDGSRASRVGSLAGRLNEELLERVRALNRIAAGRGQSLAQLALAWAGRDTRVTSVLIGASSIQQLDDSLDALRHTRFSAAELADIDRYAAPAGQRG